MNAQLQNTLADFARADGLHDFGQLGPKKDDSRTQAFDESVTGISVNNWTDEDIVLNTVFGGTKIREGLASLDDGGLTNPMPTMTGYNYRIKRVKFIGTAEANTKTGQQLAEQLGLNGSVLQVDFNHHGFLARLKTGPPAPEINVGYIWSAATINDPASKTPPHDTIFNPGGEGINLTVHKQTSGSIVFPGGLYDAGTPTKNFVSTYDVELSGITEKVSFGRRGHDSVSIKFTDPATKRNVIISDSKSQNSPAQLNSFISKLLAKLGSAQARFEISTKWQQKRSGDWLQALYAALLKVITFEPALPPGFHTFFVSHDRIAVAYALSMGVSCLYFAEDSVYAFDNRPENPGAAIERCTNELATLGGLRMKSSIVEWFFGSETVRGHVNGMNDIRNIALNEKATIITNGCAKLRGDGVPPVASLAELELTIKKVLTEALQFVFLEKAFPDEQTIRNEISSKDVCAQYKAYATLDSLFRQHDGQISIPPTFFRQFEKTMVYKTAAEWKIEPSMALPGRLLQFFRTPGESDIRDSFAFFPFIQNSNNAGIKELIATTFQKAISAITPEILTALGARTSSRISRVTLGLTNIFKQGYVYLKTEVVPEGDVLELMSKEFRAVTELPGISPDEEGPAIANRTAVVPVVQSKMSIQEVPDSSPLEEVQRGGWADRVRLVFGTEIDFDQCADPMLYAMIDYFCILNLNTVVDDLGKVVREKRHRLRSPSSAGGRRTLYSGAPTVTQTMTETVPKLTVATWTADVINLCGLLAVKRVARDSWKLDGAPTDVISYYEKGSAFLSAMCDLQPTPQNALAVRDILSHSAFMKDDDFANALAMDVNTARLYRLFFSALEESPPLQPPAEPAKHLLAVKDTFAALWKSVPQTTGATSLSIRKIADDAQWRIVDRYGIKKPAFTGVGQVLQPGMKNPSTPEELRQRRLNALDPTRKAGKRNHRARRTRRKRRTTTP